QAQDLQARGIGNGLERGDEMFLSECHGLKAIDLTDTGQDAPLAKGAGRNFARLSASHTI
ncbi:MAG TPA: hypothetical protein VFR84_08755, partial [Candidatus Angelobacter sp.]|nr:hypothetical protein [Candidatus Angelobacter sp.]